MNLCKACKEVDGKCSVRHDKCFQMPTQMIMRTQQAQRRQPEVQSLIVGGSPWPHAVGSEEDKAMRAMMARAKDWAKCAEKASAEGSVPAQVAARGADMLVEA